MNTWTAEDSRKERERQALAERLWRAEGSYCVSELVHRLARLDILPGDGSFDPVYCSDELMEVCLQDDWQTPAAEAGWTLQKQGEGYRCIKEGHEYKPDADYWMNTPQEAWREACEIDNLDPHSNEALEHWLVSKWLAERLLAKGEMVVKDFLGLTIWGRTCSGQSIVLDGVMQAIALEVYGERTVDDQG